MYALTKDKNQIRLSDGGVFNCIDGLIYYEAYKQWLAAGNVPNPPAQAEQFSSIERAIEHHMDLVAQTHKWDNRWSCTSRTGYSNPWQAEAIKFAQWMDICWQYTIQEQQKIISGTRTMPTQEEAVAELPTMVW